MRKLSLSVLIGLLVETAPVLAQQSQGPGMGEPGMGGPGGPGGMMGQYGYSRIDRNGNGYISQEEVQQQRLMERMQSNWEQAVQNGDGQVDVGEFAAIEQAHQNTQGQ